MPEIEISIKWNKQIIPIEIRQDDTISTVKKRIEVVTGITPERQKQMHKGKILKDDYNIQSIQNKSQIILLGSTNPTLLPPKETIVFEEDLTSKQKGQLKLTEPPGLVNLGNTCYANSIVQLLRAIPELYILLNKYTSIQGTLLSHEASSQLVLSLERLYTSMNATTETAVVPIEFINYLRHAVAQFNERSNGNFAGYAQQDADECLSEILEILSKEFHAVHLDGVPQKISGIDELCSFQVQQSTRLAEEELGGQETKEYEETTRLETTRKLIVAINMSTTSMLDGIKENLKERIKKRSNTLQREATFERQCTLLELPKYLFIRFNRFFWRSDTNIKAKIVRRVVFPLDLDIFEITGGTLRKQLESKRFSHSSLLKQSINSSSSSTTTTNTNNNTVENTDEMKESNDITTTTISSSLPGTDSLGHYTLRGIVTHKGRNADSGHYIAWVQSKDIWYKYDDQTVTPITSDDILKLCGGGDWHTAYIALYQRNDTFSIIN